VLAGAYDALAQRTSLRLSRNDGMSRQAVNGIDLLVWANSAAPRSAHERPACTACAGLAC